MGMYRKIFGILLCLSVLVTPGFCQEDSATPAPAEKKKVKTMIDYKDELGLSEEQIKELTTALTLYANTLKEKRTALQAQEKEYQVLLKDEAPLADIKKKLVEIMQTRFVLRYADVLTTRRVTKALTEEQMTKWKQIQSKARAAKE